MEDSDRRVNRPPLKGDREKCLAMGLDAYLAKPIRDGELLDLVQTWRPQLRAPPIPNLHTDAGCTYPVGVE